MTKRCSGVKAPGPALSGPPSIVFLNQDLTAGSPAFLVQLQHDVVNRVAPLAERREIVEALEDDVLLPEILALAAVLRPVINEGSFRDPLSSHS